MEQIQVKFQRSHTKALENVGTLDCSTQSSNKAILELLRGKLPPQCDVSRLYFKYPTYLPLSKLAEINLSHFNDVEVILLSMQPRAVLPSKEVLSPELKILLEIERNLAQTPVNAETMVPVGQPDDDLLRRLEDKLKLESTTQPTVQSNISTMLYHIDVPHNSSVKHDIQLMCGRLSYYTSSCSFGQYYSLSPTTALSELEKSKTTISNMKKEALDELEKLQSQKEPLQASLEKSKVNIQVYQVHLSQVSQCVKVLEPKLLVNEEVVQYDLEPTFNSEFEVWKKDAEDTKTQLENAKRLLNEQVGVKRATLQRDALSKLSSCFQRALMRAILIEFKCKLQNNDECLKEKSKKAYEFAKMLQSKLEQFDPEYNKTLQEFLPRLGKMLQTTANKGWATTSSPAVKSFVEMTGTLMAVKESTPYSFDPWFQ